LFGASQIMLAADAFLVTCPVWNETGSNGRSGSLGTIVGRIGSEAAIDRQKRTVDVLVAGEHCRQLKFLFKAMPRIVPVESQHIWSGD
jgi:hypothetical protein